MRRLIMVLTLMLVATLMSAGNASAKGFTSCSPVKTTINGKKYVIAIKVKTKGMSCGAAAAFWIAFATGEPGSERTEDLRTNSCWSSHRRLNSATVTISNPWALGMP